MFIEFMLSQIDKTLNEVAVQLEEENDYLSENVKKLLDLKSREGFRRNYLRPATELNLIRMAIPHKPNSRNQRYIKI